MQQKAQEKSSPIGGEQRLVDTLNRLIELYAATDKADEAAKWQAERAKHSKPTEE